MGLDTTRKIILVGDNPFHGVSHLSLERAIERQDVTDNVAYATDVVTSALDNGADGFFFSVDDTTLAMLKRLHVQGMTPDLYAIVPYSYQYVRGAIRMGGIPGLAKDFAALSVPPSRGRLDSRYPVHSGFRYRRETRHLSSHACPARPAR